MYIVEVLHHAKVRETAITPLPIPTDMSDNWDKDLPYEGMKAKFNRKCHVSFFAWTAGTRTTIKMLFILYFVSEPESESDSDSELEQESIRSLESESESEQPTTPLVSSTVILNLTLKVKTGSKVMVV